MLENKYAPIVITTFRRLDLLKDLINSLKENKECTNSDLYIFSDNYQFLKDKKLIQLVREYIDSLDGFKSIKVIKRSTNFTMSINIVDAINYVFSIHDSLIFLEEDTLVSKNFLEYMNKALKYYYNNKTVMHVSGYKYPFEEVEMKKNYFFSRLPNTWGYGLWRDKFINNFNRDYNFFINSFSEQDIYEIDFHNTSYFWKQLIQNKKRINSTFAIFWYLAIYLNKGLCLYPKKSLVENNGVDGRGKNIRNKTNQYNVETSDDISFEFDNDNVLEDLNAFLALKKYFKIYKPSILKRLLERVYNIKSKILPNDKDLSL